jgi:hypothetical protein
VGTKVDWAYFVADLCLEVSETADKIESFDLYTAQEHQMIAWQA